VAERAAKKGVAKVGRDLLGTRKVVARIHREIVNNFLRRITSRFHSGMMEEKAKVATEVRKRKDKEKESRTTVVKELR